MRRALTPIAFAASLAACAPTATAPEPAATPTPRTAPDAISEDALRRAARADSVRQHYNDADVAFMQGMIHHHAQALVMSRMAPTHGASEPIRILTARIINAQKDEIALMQRWLRERGEYVPRVAEDGTMIPPSDAGDAAHAAHAGHARAGDADHGDMHMPGMLTDRQMTSLRAARGEEWDRLFLTYMIQHHQGAITMVDELFGSYGAGQGDEIFKIASDIGADQASEIDRMQRMLQEMLFGDGGAP